MAKKLSLVLAAVAVLAFAVPAMASAAKATSPEGTLAPVGTKITGTGKNVTLKSTLLGKITCETLNLNGEITKNDGSTVEGSGENSAPTQAGCLNGTKKVTVTSVNVKNIKATETKAKGETANGTVSFVANVDVGELACVFTGENIAGTYVSGTNILKATESAGVKGSPTSCGNATLTGEFALEKTGTTTALILD